MTNTNYNNKHLTMTQRIWIEKGLIDHESFVSIARKINKHPSSISKEVIRHRYFPERNDATTKLPCLLRKTCQIHFLCNNKDCVNLCKTCFSLSKPFKNCLDVCPNYTAKICEHLQKPPYVCNGCYKLKKCNLQHAIYSAQQADDSYHDLLISAREGINQSPSDITALDALISPLLLKGQSLAHIYAHHGHEIPCSRRTLYNYIDKGIFTARNIDLRRRVRYKCKQRKTPTRVSLSAKEFRIGRTYEDFNVLMKHNPNTAVVEMDTVEGGRSNSKQVFLTLLFRSCSFMLIFVLPDKTQQSVIEVFDALYEALGTKIFNELFPIILTDNGIEFQYPKRLEYNKNNVQRTRIFYCNPNSSWQKGMIEKNHEYIRLVIPKGQSLDAYTQEHALLLMKHINSEARDSLNGCTPFKLSLLLLNNKLHKLLHLKEIPADEVTLRPTLLK